ncbi:AAA family ATPase, partial [Massilia scottii]|uniref:AAA family ATPase n=1 Tax=Massilia scottii TaxID=3057166 RepID=UPI002796C523
MFDNIFTNAPSDGRIFLLTGQNGSGKTRAMEEISKKVLADLVSGTGRTNRLLCLSGTVLDKFPRTPTDRDFYAYFGRKTNTNMISEYAPYRRLVEFLLASMDNWSDRAEIARDLLQSIGLGNQIHFKFRRGRTTKDRPAAELPGNLNVRIQLDASDFTEPEFANRLEQLRNNMIHVSSVCFTKGNIEYDISDLSSGERAYALTILTIAFCTIDNTVILFDEPENSLHPKWQASIIKDMWETLSNVAADVKLVIATHSPLIVSGALNNHTYIFDLETQRDWVHSTMFGNTSDSVLKEQFRLRTSRSILFLSQIRKCLDAMISSQIRPAQFIIEADALFALQIELDREDPLYLTYKDIKD